MTLCIPSTSSRESSIRRSAGQAIHCMPLGVTLRYAHGMQHPQGPGIEGQHVACINTFQGLVRPACKQQLNAFVAYGSLQARKGCQAILRCSDCPPSSGSAAALKCIYAMWIQLASDVNGLSALVEYSALAWRCVAWSCWRDSTDVSLYSQRFEQPAK